MAQLTIWTTELIEQTKEKLRYGMQVDMGCFHERDVELKAGKILFNVTQIELSEFTKCSMDIEYFVEKYCRFLTDKGRRIVSLRPYQHKILKELAAEVWNNKFKDMIPNIRDYILLASRQIGKTTTIAAFFSWYLCFHTDRNLLILANKERTAIEIISKVMDVFRGLPFFLKPGIINAGATGMRLDNGCQLLSQATTKTASIGFTIHVLYADEFAHIAPNIVGEFWRSVYPTLVASEISQCIISSTPAGTGNLFYEIWDNAVKGKNTFTHRRVDYWEVPDHDEVWAAKVKANFSEEYFAQEFELKFNSDSKLLLGSKELSFIKRIEKTYIYKDLDRMKLEEELFRNLKWRSDFNPNKKIDPSKSLYVISVDTGEGRDEDEVKDNDYNILTIYEVELKSLAQLRKLRPDEYFLKNMYRMNQVGLYRDNLKDDEICAKVARSLIFDQLGGESCVLVLEMNFNGKFFLNIFSTHEEYYDDIVMKTYHTKPIPGTTPPRKKAGFKVGADKEHYCKNGRSLIRSKTLIPNDDVTVLEFASFGKDKRGKYKGIGVHDDTVMATLNIARLYDEELYEDRLYDIFENWADCKEKKIINNYLNRVEENSDISDNTFNALYENEDKPANWVMTDFNDIFRAEEKNLNKRSLGQRYTSIHKNRPF